MDHVEHARQLRAREDVHFNCFQSVLVPFAAQLGLTEDQAYALGAHFGSGLRHGAVCGALSGALMVLGGLGYDEDAATAWIERFRKAHTATDCATLLAASQARGEEKKPHCDGLVLEMVAALEELAKG